MEDEATFSSSAMLCTCDVDAVEQRAGESRINTRFLMCSDANLNECRREVFFLQ